MTTPSIPFWHDSQKRKFIFQLLVLGTLLLVGYFLFSNVTKAMEKQGMSFGFSFLSQEAAFAISESLISYSVESPLGRALLVGFINTLWVAILGNLLAITWGTFVGIAQLSSNWLLARSAKSYIHLMRNIPLLLQLFFWYTLITEILPSVRNAIQIMPHTFLSQRGLALPVAMNHPIHPYILTSLSLGLLIVFFLYRWQKIRQQKTGKIFPFFPLAITVIVSLPLLTWIAGGAPTELSVPALTGFDFSGGLVIGPEFSALLLGLVLYTGAFIAEIVRSGIQSIHKGQWEAAASLGLHSGQTLRLVVLPQALRVIIPPLTSQMLNLTKNSSLAVAIGFPDFVNVANTVMNQTGKSIECISLIMVVFLTLSLLTSLLMNWYNHFTRQRTR